MNRIALAISITLIAACSHSKNDNNAAIPTDIPFNEKALPPISDADLAQAKTVAKSTGEASAPMTQVLVKNDESSDDRRNREQKFQKLKPEVQTLVRRWQIDCQANYVKEGKGIEGKPEVGKVYKNVVSIETTGAQCPVIMSEKSDTSLTVTQFTQAPLVVGMNYAMSASSRAVYNDAAQMQTVGASGFELNASMTGRMERTGETESGYSRLEATGKMNSISHGVIDLQVTVQALSRTGGEKSLTTVRVTQGGKTFVFTQFSNPEEKSKNGSRYFIGNRELSLAEVQAMGEFPFSPNQSGQTKMF